jgi:hypothetical protein
VHRCGSADLGEVVGVIAPRVAEGLAIDARRIDVVPRPQRRRAGPDATARRVDEIDAQQGEGVDDREPGAGEAGGGVGEQRTGADRAQVGLLAGQRLDPRLDLRHPGDDALIGQRQLDDAAVEGPRTDPDARAEPSVEGVASDLHRLLTVLAAGRRAGSPPRRRLAR